jgi:hypothetical protein
MRTKTFQSLLPAILLGGLLFTAGCSTPTTTVGLPSKSDRTVLSVSSPLSTRVQCTWTQDGNRVQHQGTTPFRLVFPASSVYEVSLTKPVDAAGVEVKLHPAGAPLSHFVMERGSSGMRLVCDNRHWEGRVF